MIAVSSEFCANNHPGVEQKTGLDGRIEAARVTDTCCGWNGKCPHGPMCSNTWYPASGTVQGSRGTWGCGAQLVDTHYPVIPPWLKPMETEPQEVPTLRALISCTVTATSDQK